MVDVYGVTLKAVRSGLADVTPGLRYSLYGEANESSWHQSWTRLVVEYNPDILAERFPGVNQTHLRARVLEVLATAPYENFRTVVFRKVTPVIRVSEERVQGLVDAVRANAGTAAELAAAVRVLDLVLDNTGSRSERAFFKEVIDRLL